MLVQEKQDDMPEHLVVYTDQQPWEIFFGLMSSQRTHDVIMTSYQRHVPAGICLHRHVPAGICLHRHIFLKPNNIAIL